MAKRLLATTVETKYENCTLGCIQCTPHQDGKMQIQLLLDFTLLAAMQCSTAPTI